MPLTQLEDILLLPELKLTTVHAPSYHGFMRYICQKESELEVCPKCASPSRSIYDRRKIEVKDQPIHGKVVWLHIWKRRFWCKKCQKPFTEPVPGIAPRRRTTQRYRRALLWAADHFSCLKEVQKAFQCSAGLLYQALYEQLDLMIGKRQDPWPKVIGIDEHSFQKREKGSIPFVTVIADYNRKRLAEVVPGKDHATLSSNLAHIEGRENVAHVILDLSKTYKSFAQGFFPNADLIADKFHVLRLLHPWINKARKDITGDKRTLLIRKLLLKNGKSLSYFTRYAVHQWLKAYPNLEELYQWKERLHGFYRIKGYNRARKVLIRMLDEMAQSLLPEIKRLRTTLRQWHQEILNYFRFNRLTNARTEGYNNKAKLIKRRAYGYKSFQNYRRRLLCACYSRT